MKNILNFSGGILLAVTVATLVISFCFSEFYFIATNLNLAALDLINGKITSEELRNMGINGFRMTWPEINHIQDVAELLRLKNIALWILLPLAFLPFIFSHERRFAIASWALGIFTAIAGGATICVYFNGARHLRDILHNLFFPQGGWQFQSNQLILQLYPPNIIQESLVIITMLTAVALFILWVIAMFAKPRIITTKTSQS